MAIGPHRDLMLHTVDVHQVLTLGVEAAGELLTLQRAAYVPEAAAHTDFGLPPLTQTYAELLTELSSSHVVARGIRDEGRLIGAVRLHRDGPVIELGRLIVAPDRQGEGIGTLLLRDAESVFADAREIRLFTGEHSSGPLRLYLHEGYRETGRTSAGHYDLVHFVKHLG